MLVRPLLVSSLAAHRAARAIAVDSITEAWRERMNVRLLRPKFKRNGELDMPATSRRVFVAELIECPHCVGFHLSYLTFGAYLLAINRRWRWLQFLVEAWAVAGVQSTLASAQAALDTLGHIDADEINEANEAESERQ